MKTGMGASGFIARKSSLYINVTWYCENWNRIYTITISEHATRPLPLKRKIDVEAFQNFSKEFISTIKCHLNNENYMNPKDENQKHEAFLFHHISSNISAILLAFN